jgi:hypothetical protein
MYSRLVKTISEARRAKVREAEAYFVQYVDAKRTEHNEAYESFWAACYGLILVIFDP